LVLAAACPGAEIKTNNQPAQLDIREAGQHSIRVTLKPVSYKAEFPFSPALAERKYATPALSLKEISQPVKARLGSMNVEVLPDPLTIVATTTDGKPIQRIVFGKDGTMSFAIGGQPLLGLGEGGPLPRGNFRTLPVEFDRRGRLEDMRPRWQSDAYLRS
jgi:alpha-glucosidase/alpha-D-xyloside xylohydrolase